MTSVLKPRNKYFLKVQGISLVTEPKLQKIFNKKITLIEFLLKNDIRFPYFTSNQRGGQDSFIDFTFYDPTLMDQKAVKKSDYLNSVLLANQVTSKQKAAESALFSEYSSSSVEEENVVKDEVLTSEKINELLPNEELESLVQSKDSSSSDENEESKKDPKKIKKAVTSSVGLVPSILPNFTYQPEVFIVLRFIKLSKVKNNDSLNDRLITINKEKYKPLFMNSASVMLNNVIF